LDALRDEAIRLTADLIRVDTSNPPGREAEAARLLRDFLEANGVACELAENVPGRPNLIARIPGSGEAPSLALIGHTDVVPADAQDWQHPPFAGHLGGDGYLWGRGAVDMKNQTATRALAMALAARSGVRPRGDLMFIAQADEEVGVEDVGMRWLVKARPDLRVDNAIDEGGGGRVPFADGRVAVTIECGQKAVLPVTVTALSEAGHASVPEPGKNAVPVLARLISRIDAYRPARRLTPETRRMFEIITGGAADDLEAALARACELSPWLAPELPALVSTTMAPTRLHGSTALNVMPARASVEVDCRVLPGTTEQGLLREMREALGTDIPYELDLPDPLVGGATSGIDSPLFEACQSYIDGVDPGARLLPFISTGFADSNYLREAWGTVAYGFWPWRYTDPHVVDAGMHNRDERIHVDDLAYGLRGQLHIIREMVAPDLPAL
jgi:acetylornithine deacetylase/succinyl-diaminopimelate desuccinylase-like protein